MILDGWDVPANGLVVSSRRFVDALRAHGHQVDVFATGHPEPGKIPMPSLSLPLLQPLVEDMGFPLGRPSKKIFESELQRYDVVHVQAPFFMGWGAVRAASRLGLPIVGTFHVQAENMLRNLGISSQRPVPMIYKTFNRYIFNRCRIVVFPSNLGQSLLSDAGLKAPARVISNGVPDRFFQAPESASRRDPETTTVLGVGRLADEKRQDLIVSAVAMSEFRDSIRLVLVGRGPKTEAVRQQAEREGLNAEIGPRDDAGLLAAYREADIFIHASEIELESLTTLEAMASHCPALIADSPTSAAPQFATGEDMLFRPDDAGDLAGRLDHWIRQPEARAAAAQRCHDQAENYRLGRSVDQLVTTYREIIDSNPGPH